MKELIETIDELRIIEGSGLILHPNRRLLLTCINTDIVRKINANDSRVFISRRSIKHILERRVTKADIVFGELVNVIEKPTKIANNSSKRKNSFLFIRATDITVAVVVEVTERPGDCQVVSAFLMDQKTYEKLIDISGRAEFPPFELPS